MGIKGPSTAVVPMCFTHDRLWSTQGPVVFAERTGLGRQLLRDAAEATEAGWKAYLGENSE